jgi:hypothetical protein
VKGILADVNIQGQVDFLVAVMKAEPWKLFWDHLGLELFHFPDVGLAADSADSVVWDECQQRQLILITDNRNQHDADSLEITIRQRNTPSSLPVFTIGSLRRLQRERSYAQQVIEDMLDALLRIEDLRGIGRLFLPYSHGGAP